ncbi:MAG TPA: S9 family peptidase [Caulobacteraceae bacterium]|jgi:dipeptidyl aminopeptidase/acylaminoacyl peptidase|nr:S9 family peptidase [Caulobacteraceae bacterium]
MWLRAALLVALLALAGRAEALTGKDAADPAAPLPTSAFFEHPRFSALQISPSGSSLAIARRDGLQVSVAVTDLATGKGTTVFIGDAATTTLDWVRWKGERRLLIGVTFGQFARQAGDIVHSAFGRYIIAVDSDGQNKLVLLRTSHAVEWRNGVVIQLLDLLRGDPDHVLAIGPKPGGALAIWRTDVRTGEGRMVESGDSETIGWDTDRSGEVVLRGEKHGPDEVILGRATSEAAWAEVARITAKDVKALGDFEVLGAATTPGAFYVAVKPKSAEDGAARTVRIFDLRTRALGPALWPAHDYDVSNIVTIPGAGTLAAVCFWVDAFRCEFQDGRLDAAMKTLGKRFQSDRSILPLSISDDARWWVLLVSGPSDPGGFYLFDAQAMALTAVGDRLADLPAARLGLTEPFTYAASDGVKIHSYVTRPPDAPAGPLPLVVLPHGGPEARDNLDFDVWRQVLATRGYLVFQPNFRGSGGYGVAFAESGYGKWGGRMEDDITDGIKQLVDNGQVDPKRICIFGGSYGGYAALIGAAQRPDLYKCVVSLAGISDLPAFLKFKRGAFLVGERSPSYDYWVKAIGDPDADKTRLAQASAVTFADRYQAPVLLIHGDADTNVPADQSREMERALKAAHKDVTLTLIKGEDHTDWDPANEEKAIEQVVDFIAAHIAPAKPPSPPAAPVAASDADPKP